MSVVFAPASLIPPVPIRLRTTFFPYYSVLLSYRGGQEQPDQAARKFLKIFFFEKRRGIFGRAVFIAHPMWDFSRRRRQETGSSFYCPRPFMWSLLFFFFVLMSSFARLPHLWRIFVSRQLSESS